MERAWQAAGPAPSPSLHARIGLNGGHLASKPYPVDAPLYAPSEAARFSGLSVGHVRRWLFGYTYRYGGTTTAQAPIIHKPRSSDRYAAAPKTRHHGIGFRVALSVGAVKAAIAERK